MNDSGDTACDKRGTGRRLRVAALLPNLLTVIRLLLGLAFPWIPSSWRVAAFVVAAVTDLVDGTLSRLLRATSTTGRLLDPIADKCLVLCVLGTLVWEGRLDVWQAVVVVLRDAAALGGSGWIVLRHGWSAQTQIQPRWLGKWTTGAQFAFLLSLLIWDTLIGWLFVVTAVLSFLAGVDYLLSQRRPRANGSQ